LHNDPGWRRGGGGGALRLDLLDPLLDPTFGIDPSIRQLSYFSDIVLLVPVRFYGISSGSKHLSFYDSSRCGFALIKFSTCSAVIRARAEHNR